MFKIKTLSEISGKTIADILSDLKQAVLLEVIVSIKNDNRIAGETEFQFSHDRFQQTFYMILPESERATNHYDLARYYEKTCLAKNEDTKEQFIIADNYAKAFSIIATAIEKRRVAEILIRVVCQACLVSAFDTAIQYLEQIIGSLAAMKADQDFSFRVYTEYHYTLCSLANYQQADEIYRLLERLVKEPIRLTDSCCLQAVCLSNRGRYQEAFLLGTALLEKLGVHFPADDLDHHINDQINDFYDILEKNDYVGIDGKSENTDRKEIAIGKLLNRITSAGFFYDPPLFILGHHCITRSFQIDWRPRQSTLNR